MKDYMEIKFVEQVGDLLIDPDDNNVVGKIVDSKSDPVFPVKIVGKTLESWLLDKTTVEVIKVQGDPVALFDKKSNEIYIVKDIK